MFHDFSGLEAGYKIWLEQQKVHRAGERTSADLAWMDWVVDASVAMAKAMHAANPAIGIDALLKKAVELGHDALDLDMEWIAASEKKVALGNRRDMASRFSRCLSAEQRLILIEKYVEHWPWAGYQLGEVISYRRSYDNGGRLRSEEAPKSAPELDRSLWRMENLLQGLSEASSALSKSRQGARDGGKDLACEDQNICEASLAQVRLARGWLSRALVIDAKTARKQGEIVWSKFEQGALMESDVGAKLSAFCVEAIGESEKWGDAHLRSLASMRGCQSLRRIVPAATRSASAHEQAVEALELCERLASSSGDALAIAECQKVRVDMRVARMGEDDWALVEDLLAAPKDGAQLVEALAYRVESALESPRAPQWMLEDAARLHASASGFGADALEQARESMCELLAGLGARGDERVAWVMSKANDEGLGAAVAKAAPASDGNDSSREWIEKLGGAFGSAVLDAAAGSLKHEIEQAKGQFAALVEAAALSASIGRARVEKKSRARL